jgi:hypothetical protein
MFGRLKNWLSGRRKPDRHPLNAPGDFYVLNNMCISCEAPETEAPELMSHCAGDYQCYFKRQPSTPDEVEHAILAVVVGCCGAVRYGGRDKAVIARIIELSPSAADDCDHAL